MTIVELQVTSGVLRDVQRRYVYVAVTLFGRRIYLQWWPRPVRGKRFLEVGAH